MWGVVTNDSGQGNGNNTGQSLEHCVRLIPGNDGQTDFIISPVPNDVLNSKFFINGGKQMINIDYTLDTLGRFKWISTKLKLKTTHLLELYYK